MAAQSPAPAFGHRRVLTPSLLPASPRPFSPAAPAFPAPLAASLRLALRLRTCVGGHLHRLTLPKPPTSVRAFPKAESFPSSSWPRGSLFSIGRNSVVPTEAFSGLLAVFVLRLVQWYQEAG